VASTEAQLTTALREACATMVELRVRHALVGGLAVSARAEPRLTRDVDLVLAVDDDIAAEALVRELVARRYRVVATVEHATGRLATVRLTAPASELVVDLIFATCGIEEEIVEAAELVEILPGLTVPLATARHLVAMKLLARDDRTRPQDLDDLRALIPLLDANERRRVPVALRQIVRRGYARGRDLVAAWRELISEA
jgi:predicted nucleotidyltransferase